MFSLSGVRTPIDGLVACVPGPNPAIGEFLRAPRRFNNSPPIDLPQGKAIGDGIRVELSALKLSTNWE